LVDLCLPIVGVELSHSAARISATYKAVSLRVMAIDDVCDVCAHCFSLLVMRRLFSWLKT